MAFQLITFQGDRLAFLNYNTDGKPGGYADFGNFKGNEPRERGIERMIALGKTITPTSGNAESFQWINLMRGDVMFMSLVKYRYLATAPNRSGPVTIFATGPRPDRTGGACFKW